MSQSPDPAGAEDAPTITVIHGRQRHSVRLTDFSHELMCEIAEVTSIKVEDQVLIVGGKKLTAQDDVELASLGLKKGKKVLVMGNGGRPEHTASFKVPFEDEKYLRQRVLQSTYDLSSVESTIAEIAEQMKQPISSLKNIPPASLGKMKMDVLIASERCMKMLILLDSIVDEGNKISRSTASWKAERKNAVDRLQNALDSVDSILKAFDDLSASNEKSEGPGD